MEEVSFGFPTCREGDRFQAGGPEGLSPDSKILASTEVIQLPGLREWGEEARGRGLHHSGVCCQLIWVVRCKRGCKSDLRAKIRCSGINTPKPMIDLTG